MHKLIPKVKNVRCSITTFRPAQVKRSRSAAAPPRDEERGAVVGEGLLSNRAGGHGGGARQHCEGRLAAEARRAHSQLARPLLHPVRQWRPGGLQDAARTQQLPGSAQQVHGA